MQPIRSGAGKPSPGQCRFTYLCVEQPGKHERQHNEWSGYTRQIIFGLPILPPDQQTREYALDAAACGWPAWDGAVERQARVEIAPGVTVTSAAPLPTLPEARAWFLDRLGADVAQAAGRLRACRATRPVRVDVFGAVPLIGHGLHTTGFEIAAGAARTRGDKVQAIAAAIANLPAEAERSQRAIQRECERHGFRPDRRLVARVLAQARIEVEQSGHTLIAAAAALCQRARSLIVAYGHDGALAIASEALDKGEASRWFAIAGLIECAEAHEDHGGAPLAVTTPA